MTTLADKSLLSGGDNKPPMLEKHLYDSWKSRMELYMMNRPHGRMILASVEKGPFVWPSITVEGVTRLKEYTELTPAEAIQADCDIKAINIILQGCIHQLHPYNFQSHQLHTLPNSQLQHHVSPYPSSQFVTPYQTQQFTTSQSTPLSITYPSNEYQSSVHHNVYSPQSSIPQLEYAPTTYQHQQSEFSQPDSGLIVPVFQKGDDPIDAINHMMSFLTVVVTSRYPTTNNQLRTSSNPRQQATIYDGKVTVQPVQGRQTTYAAGTTRKYTPGASGSNTGKQRTVIYYNCKGEGHIVKQCTKPKRKRDKTWFNDKVLLVQVQVSGQALTEEEITFLAKPRLPYSQTSQTVITHNAAYQADDLDAYDFDCDELISAKIALMANLSRNGSDALTEVYNPDNLTYDLFNQSEQIMTSSEQSNDETVQNSNSSAQQDVLILSMFEQLNTQVMHCTNVNLEYKSANKALTTELDRYKEEVKDLKEMQNVENSFSGSNEQYAEIVRLKETLFEQVQEKDSLMKTVSDLKNDLKMEENRNIDREIALEKKIKQLDNIIFKRGQSAQTVHMMTKSKICYDHSTKQAGFEKPFKSEESAGVQSQCYPSHSSHTIKFEFPKELPNVSDGEYELEKLNGYRTGFDQVVKERTTATQANTEDRSKEHDTIIRSGNDAHVDDADIRPTYNEEPMAENAEQCHDICPLPTILTDDKTTELANQSLESENICLKKTVAQFQRDFAKIERKHIIQKKGFAIAALKNELRKLTGNSVNTKFAKPSILGKPVGQPLKNQSVVRQPTAFKSERPRISKPRFASQVDVNNDLSKPVTTHHLPKGRESAPAKPHHMIAPSSSRYSSNDIVHNHYLEEAKKKTHEHSRIPRNFSDSKHFVCSTCQKCVFNANHDACVIKFLKEVNSRAKVPSNKTTNRNKPVEQIRVATKPKRQIPKGHRFSIKKTTTVHEKTTSPRSCLRWQPTGRILKTVCLRWVPTGKTFASSTTKVESEPPNGSNADIPNQCESEQALNVSAGTLLSTADQASVFMAMMSVHISSGLVLHQMTSDHNRSELGIHDHSNEQSSSKLVPKSCSLSKQDSYITTRVGITIPPSYSNAEDNRYNGLKTKQKRRLSVNI
ncbi:hypothetical protein Tco_1505046 [Tanacetum coccineum]